MPRNPQALSADRAMPVGATTLLPVSRRTLRAIAAFEAFKGGLAVAAGLGLLGTLHHNLHAIAVTLIGHIGLNPGDRYPAMALRNMDQLLSQDLHLLLLAAGGYATLRLTEAYGLWTDRRWGEWLGALSGALYLPFEIRHLIHKPGFTGVLVIALNVAVVGFLGWRLRHQRRHEIQTR